MGIKANNLLDKIKNETELGEYQNLMIDVYSIYERIANQLFYIITYRVIFYYLKR